MTVDESPRLDSKVPDAPIETMWEDHKFDMKLVNPNNKRRFTVIVVGTGLAGASAAATMAELGYNVEAFTFHDSPRRAHSIAAQGGINAAKNYHGDGDSVFRLFYDTVKGGDYRSREANVYRLAQVSNDIIDQATAQGVPFAREYGGRLDNRSFGGAQVSRTFYARGQTGQQLLLGAYQALARQVKTGKVRLHTQMEMLEVVVKDGRARGIICRDLVTGEITRHAAHAVVLATGGYSNAFYLSTNAMACNVTAAWRAHRKGAMFANPCFTQIHPTAIPASDEFQSKLTLMSESLRNDGRIWVPKDPDESRRPGDIPEEDRDYYLERKYPAFGNLVPRDVASRNAKTVVDEGRGVGPLENGVYLDFKDAIGRLGEDVIADRYGNLFEMYERITGENPYRTPMRIFPAPHYTMGGLWVDYHLHDHRRGPVRDRRGELLRPRCQPAGCLGADAGPRRRLLRPALHHRRLPGRQALRAGHGHRRTGLRRRRGRGHRSCRQAARHQRHAHGGPLPPRARQDPVGLLRHGPQRAGAREGPDRDPRAPRGVLEGRARARFGRRRSTAPSRRPVASPTSSSSASSWSATR